MVLFDLFDQLEKKMHKELLPGREKDRLLSDVVKVRQRYSLLGPIDEESGVASGLIAKGRSVVAARPFQAEEATMFLRYARAAAYDLSGNLGPYKWYVRCFFASAIAFFLLAPQFFPVIIALLFILPVYLGIRGVKNRSSVGFTMSAMIFPVALLSGITAFKAFVVGGLLGGLGAYATQLGGNYGVSQSTAEGMIILFSLVSVVSIVASLAGVVIGIRHRGLFT